MTEREHLFFPSPPPGGGVLVLNSAQIGCLDLLCAIRTMYPNTKIIAQQPIPHGSAFGEDYRVTGYRVGPQPMDETEHFIKCPCGHMIDCRDLGEVLSHVACGEEQKR